MSGISLSQLPLLSSVTATDPNILFLATNEDTSTFVSVAVPLSSIYNSFNVLSNNSTITANNNLIVPGTLTSNVIYSKNIIYSNTIQANTSVNTSLVYSTTHTNTGNIYTDILQANTSINTKSILVYGGVIATNTSAPTIASTGNIAPTRMITFISGVAPIANITPPPFIATGGGQLTLIPTAVWSTNTAGNIGLASTAVVSKALIMTWDVGTGKWYPSY